MARGLYWFCGVTGTLAFVACVGLVVVYLLTNEPGAKYIGAVAAAVTVVAYVIAGALRASRRDGPPGFDIISRPPSDA